MIQNDTEKLPKMPNFGFLTSTLFFPKVKRKMDFGHF